MPSIGDLTSRLQYKARIESVTKDLVHDIKDEGVVQALIGLGSRFGRNNRKLVQGII